LDLFDCSSSASTSDQDCWKSPDDRIRATSAFDDLIALPRSGLIVDQDGQAAFERRAADVRLGAVRQRASVRTDNGSPRWLASN
jgi:hypothetical protein